MDLSREFERAGCRRLAVLVEHLPEHGAFKCDGDWTPDMHLLASLVEVVDFWGRQHSRQFGAKDSQLPPRVEFQRPKDEAKEKTGNKSVAAMKALFSSGGR